MKRPSRRVLASGGAAVAVATVAIAVPVLAGSDAQRSATGPRPPSPAHAAQPFQPTTHIDRLVVRNGATVLAEGKVLALPGRSVRLCAPVVESGVGTTRDTRFDKCDVGLDVTGVDLDRLSHRIERQRDGAVVGDARLTGTYRDKTLAVARQTGPRRHMFDTLPKPPCAPPDGGWPRGRRNENLDVKAVLSYKRAHPGSVIDLANLRPSDQQVVVHVVTAGHPAPVEAALRPHYGKRLCVVQSRWTRTQLTDAMHETHALMRRSDADGLTKPMGTGRWMGPGGQPQVFADMLIVTPATAHRLERLPMGIVALDAWLVPR